MKITRRQLRKMIIEEASRTDDSSEETSSIDTDDIDLEPLTGELEAMVSQISEGARLSDADFRNLEKLTVVTLKAFQALTKATYKGGTYSSLPPLVKGHIVEVKNALQKIYKKMNFRS